MRTDNSLIDTILGECNLADDDDTPVEIPIINGGGSARKVNLAMIARGSMEGVKLPCNFCHCITHRVIASKAMGATVYDKIVYCCDFCFRAIRQLQWNFEGE